MKKIKLIPQIKLIPLLTCILCIMGCANINSQIPQNMVSFDSKEFHDYWYSGDAELTRYELEQARYGEVFKGDAVLIFVTEDFWTDKQVKYEGGKKTNKVKPILKLNFTRKFFTGIYPYSMMSSIFSPIDGKQSAIKVTTSSQEWCGHTFSQLNLNNNKYKGKLFSYFQEEGDQEFQLDKALLEEEIWSKIRLNPASLPTGNIKLIPNTQATRLNHRKVKVENATASIKSFQDATLSNKPLNKYRVEYKDFKRVVEIYYETEFPYVIVGWEEQMMSGFRDPKLLTTRAVRTHSINSPYWGKHSLADAKLRKELGLDESNY